MPKKIDVYFLLIMIEDVDPLIYGPFSDAFARDQAALNYRQREGHFEDGLFMLDITQAMHRPTVSTYPSKFFEQETLNAAEYTTHT